MGSPAYGGIWVYSRMQDCPSIALRQTQTQTLDRQFPTVFAMIVTECLSRVCSTLHSVVQFGPS